MHDDGNGESDFEIEAGSDSTYANFDFNSPAGRAIAQVYAKRYQEKSDRLATYVNEEVEKTNRPALGVSQRQKGIWVLQATNMPAILIETGFINNPKDEEYLNSESGQQEMAATIADAIVRYKNQMESMIKTNGSSSK
jgi:N-acetylmuramoyl-L-alanine amidase